MNVFAWEKDMNFGRPVVEYYGLYVYVSPFPNS